MNGSVSIETYLIGGALAFVLKDIRSLEHKSHNL